MNGKVSIWRCELDDLTALPEAVLDDHERRRADAFKFDRDRGRFIASRHFLRSVLAEHLGREPAALMFRINAHGKPFLLDDSLSFNLSHSKNIAYLAVADRGDIGIDVELARSFADALSMARMVFSDAELAELENASVTDRARAFLRCWTRKEAYVKALGVGIAAVNLRLVTVGTNASPITVSSIEALSVSPLQVRTLDVGEQEYVALAWTETISEIEYRQFGI